MQHEKLHSTHKRLSFLFTGVVFLLIIFLGVLFLYTKYYNDQREEKRDFLGQVLTLSSGIQNDENFFESFLSRQDSYEKTGFQDLKSLRQRSQNHSNISFVIIDGDNNIIFRNILEQASFGNIDLSSPGIYRENGSYIIIKELDENVGVFYKTVRFDGKDLWENFILLFVLALLSSGVLYFIGYRFVGKTLIPIEENLKDMQDFIHNAGHELKTPLAVMRGNLQIMQAEKSFDIKLLQQSIWQVDTMNGLIESLSELSELGSLSEKQNISLVWELENVRAEFQEMLEEKNIEFLGLTSEKPSVFANKDELHLLLSNLIKNAIKYTEKGGKIEVKYNKNTLSIIDSGVGISKEDQVKIFDRFFQGENARSSDGFGIGLSLVKKIADANNWKLFVESKLSEGTTFKITF